MPRVERVYEHNFLMIDKTPLTGGKNGLSLKARGFLCTISSLKPDWRFTIAGLASIIPDGERAIKSCIKELEDSGYLKREQSRDSGRLSDNVWYISDIPIAEWIDQSDSPLVRNAPAENALAQNAQQLSTYSLSTYESTGKNISKKSHVDEAFDGEFAELWSEYPRKANKKGAEKAYRAARKRGVKHNDILAGVMAYASHCRASKTDQQFILHCSTFINQERWNDDWSFTAKPQQQSSFYGVDTSSAGWGDFR